MKYIIFITAGGRIAGIETKDIEAIEAHSETRLTIRAFKAAILLTRIVQFTDKRPALVLTEESV